MIEKERFIELISEEKKLYRKDNQVGSKAYNAFQFIEDYIKTLSGHETKDLLVGKTKNEIEDIEKEINKRLNKIEKEKLKKIYTLSVKNENEELMYFFKDFENLKKEMIELISNEDINNIGKTTYKKEKKYIKECLYKEVKFEDEKK